jgi:hypothetical protein
VIRRPEWRLLSFTGKHAKSEFVPNESSTKIDGFVTVSREHMILYKYYDGTDDCTVAERVSRT